ncbi:hypothetical protein JXB27_03695 [Candidatus Woesearchaeota archaeon]|nr:hypothetical protein [Candidatus Woesearchaeota archaeon]
MSLETKVKDSKFTAYVKQILGELGGKTQENQKEIIEKLSAKERTILYCWAGIYEGSQRPKRQEAFEKKYGLPKNSAFKANIAVSTAEAAAIFGLSYLSAEFGEQVRNSWLNGFFSGGEQVTFWDAAAISANLVGRSLYYVIKNKPAFTCWGWRAAVVGADYTMGWINKRIGKKAKEKNGVDLTSPPC